MVFFINFNFLITNSIFFFITFKTWAPNYYDFFRLLPAQALDNPQNNIVKYNVMMVH